MKTENKTGFESCGGNCGQCESLAVCEREHERILQKQRESAIIVGSCLVFFFLFGVGFGLWIVVRSIWGMLQ